MTKASSSYYGGGKQSVLDDWMRWWAPRGALKEEMTLNMNSLIWLGVRGYHCQGLHAFVWIMYR